MLGAKKYLLGIDLGSGSVKLTLLTKEGDIAAANSSEYPTIYPCVGWAEQSTLDWRLALKIGIKNLLQSCNANANEIAAIAPDAATHTAVLLDKNMVPLDRAILWTDQRSIKEVAYLEKHYLDVVLNETLHAPTTIWTLPQLMWVKENKPELWSSIRTILFAKDYLRYCITGTVGTDNIEAIGSMFYDVNNEKWSETLCDISKISKEWMPNIFQPTDLAGYVTRAAEEEFGLSQGTPVFIGTTDTALEQLAAGSVEVGHSVIKLATAGRICVISDKAHPSPFLYNYPHVVPGLWYPGTTTSSCAASYRWFRDTLGNMSYDALNEGALNISPGSEGLMFHPFLQGALTPYNDSQLCASFTGINARHTKAHFTRAVLEGVAFSLRDCIETLENEDLHLHKTRTRIIGGGAKSSLWRQIVADTLGITLEKAIIDDSSFGAAMLAGVSLGWFSSFKDAAERCVKVQSTTYPNQDNHEHYEKQFEKYKKIHDALAPIYHEK